MRVGETDSQEKKEDYNVGHGIASRGYVLRVVILLVMLKLRPQLKSCSDASCGFAANERNSAIQCAAHSSFGLVNSVP